MQLPPRLTRTHRADDRGSAMILAIAFIVLLTALAATGTAVAVRDLRAAGQARQAGTAFVAAEAGIAQAISYLRAYGPRKVRCYPTCTTNPWNPTNPAAAQIGAARWQAWIAPVSTGNGSGGDRYLLHAVGTAPGQAQRIIETDVALTPIDLPKAVVARTINAGGTVDLYRISVFSTGCVYKRDKLSFHPEAGPDLAYGSPAAVHSSQIITESQGAGQYCPTTAKPIHRAGAADQPCNSAYPGDQDRYGGGLVGHSACAESAAHPAHQPRDLDGDGALDVNGSFIRDDRSLFTAFGITRPALSEADLNQLRAIAQAQGNYHASATAWTVPAASNPHAVLYFDLNGATVNLDPLGTSAWARSQLEATDPRCPDASLLVIVTGGNAKINANTNLAATVYLSSPAPYGRLEKANGTANHIGALYADTIDMTGTFSVSLDTCYLDNPPPALTHVDPTSYRELDR